MEKDSKGKLSDGPCKILIKFRHGLGDNVQLLIPLQHMAKQRPQWTVDVMVISKRENIFYKTCNKIFNYERQPIEEHYDWIYENDTMNKMQLNQPILCMELPDFDIPGFPQSWPLHFLKKELNLNPEIHLFDCNIQIQKRYEDIASKSIKWDKFVVIHYEGTTNKFLTYFTELDVRLICNLISEKGYTPVILDLDHTSKLPKNIARAEILQESGILAAFLRKAHLFIGIDSGPLHIAGATGINCIGLWELTSPQYLYALNQNVIHYHPYGFRKLCPKFRTTDNYMQSISDLL